MWSTVSSLSPRNFYLLFCYLLSITEIIIIIIIYLLFESFERQQVSSSLQDSSQYSGRSQ